MKLTWARTACSHPALSGVSRAQFGELFAELASAWEAVRQSALREAWGGERVRAEGAGRKPKLVFLDRLLVTLVHLRHQLPHVVLAELFEVDRSTVSVAIRQVRPMLAARGFAVPDRPGLRLKTLEDVFAYAEAEGVELRLDGAETQVRRPQADRPGHRAFVSGKRKQNTIKTTTFSDGQGRLLLSGLVRPGRMHDQTAVRTEGIAEQFHTRPGVKAKVDSGYLRLAKEFPGQVSAPPKKPKDEARDGDKHAWRETRRRQSSARICVEHANAELRQWAPCAGSPGAVIPTPRPISRSPHSSPTDPHSGPPAAGRAPHSSSSATPSADHPPAEPPGQHARTSISPETVRARSDMDVPQAPVLSRSPVLSMIQNVQPLWLGTTHGRSACRTAVVAPLGDL
ncbi:transposase family protein [Streptomyces sp. Isolate_219]|uniref:transposase family protein n=1 Tax=Streptomyces sp. Isolate_219 TaxID=2950110 RepID=UPI002905E4F1|nr:transposase family protein [Streptomyces sp. Isolate_219]